MTPRAGCSYFGVRILRHVREDLDDLARRGFTGVLHTWSENDLAYYRGTMAEIVAASHAAGLEVQVSPWALGRTFGGEAESRFVTFHPDACQVLDDGARVAVACLNNPDYRAFCREWADAVVAAGVDKVFWDEPHWVQPEHVGVADPERWGCRCDVCVRLWYEHSGGEMPRELTDEVLAFREASIVGFLRDMSAHVAGRGGRSTICLLPLTEGPHGVSDWDAVAALPGVVTLATDPYWKNFGEPAGPFVERFARLVAETAARHGIEPQLWVPSFGLAREEIPELEAAISSARAAGVDDVWTWGYEACGHMTSLATPDSPVVWEAVTTALTGRSGLDSLLTESNRAELHDLDLRPTREIVRVINEEDATVAGAVATAEGPIATAVDAIVDRLRAGGRLVYAGAGTSGRIACADAEECGPTFSVEPGLVVALTVDEEPAEDDVEAGVEAVRRAAVGPQDAVVAVSASGRTPFTLAAAREARRAGALTVALACVRESELAQACELAIEVETGAEVIGGSTRMKAGTAQKLVLNTISTVAMVQLGKTLGNLMVDVRATNEKLRARAMRAAAAATGATEAEVAAAFEAADGETKVAIVSLAAGVDAETARARLAAADGSVREALREAADVVG